MKPRASTPARRLAAIEELSRAGIPVGCMVAPIIPGLSDHEIPSILSAVANAGALRAGYTMVRLPYAVSDLFQEWLAEHYPDRKEKVLNHIRDSRGGKLNDPNFKTRMKGEGVYAEQIKALFNLCAKKWDSILRKSKHRSSIFDGRMINSFRFSADSLNLRTSVLVTEIFFTTESREDFLKFSALCVLSLRPL